MTLGESRKKSMISVPASSDYTLGGNDVDMTGIVGNFRTPSGASEQCLLKKLPNGKLGEIIICFLVLLILIRVRPIYKKSSDKKLTNYTQKV